MRRYDSGFGSGGTVGLHEGRRRESTADFFSAIPWFDSLLPSGVPVPSSMVISGPSGTGKPFAGLALAGSWLRPGVRNAGFYGAAVPIAAMPEFAGEPKNGAVASRRILVSKVGRV